MQLLDSFSVHSGSLRRLDYFEADLSDPSSLNVNTAHKGMYFMLSFATDVVLYGDP